MMKDEFEKGVGQKISTEEYGIIETVYTYYPAFGDKEQVYRLFRQFGMALFYDLTRRAETVKVIEEELRQLQVKHSGLLTGRL